MSGHRWDFGLTRLGEMIAAFDVPEFPGSPLSGDDYTAAYQQLTGWTPASFVTSCDS